MKFELGKQYIVDVSDKGIIPIQEFTHERFFDKDCDPLDFLTGEEKTLVVNDVLDKIKAEITTDKKKWWYGVNNDCFMKLSDVLSIIDKYRKESVNE